MKKEIWKYVIHPETQEINMPCGSIILSVDVQYEKICIWVEVDLEQVNNPYKTRRFKVYGTGHLISIPHKNRQFIGTVKLSGGSLIFHVFEV